MLLTLNANSLRRSLSGTGAERIALDDLPRYTRQTLGLNGLTIPTSMLAGLSRTQLSRLREEGDRAGCAVLSLWEDEVQPVGAASMDTALAGVERLGRVLQAAHVLGCSAIVTRITAGPGDEGVARAIERMKMVTEKAERLEVSVLLAPGDGQTATPEGLTLLIKRVGGFRVGACPDFEAASKSADPALFMRRLTPYASAASASMKGFVIKRGDTTVEVTGDELDEDGEIEHGPYPVEPLVKAMVAVGYDGSLAIDYRGRGNATLGVLHSRTVLERALETAQREDE